MAPYNSQVLQAIQLKLSKHEPFTYKTIKKTYIYYMQMKKNMTKILMIVYALMIFIFPLIVVSITSISFLHDFIIYFIHNI